MTEQPEANSDEQSTESQQESEETPDTTDWKAEARKWEQRAKENRGKANEFDKRLKANMNESERAVAEAEERGRTNATKTYGERLARTQFDALAARRNPDFKTDDVLEYVDLAKMIGEDGEPDSKALSAAVTRLVPEASGKPPSFDGGSRSAASGKDDMNSLIRKGAGLA